jgi:hypothetical protein
VTGAVAAASSAGAGTGGGGSGARSLRARRGSPAATTARVRGLLGNISSSDGAGRTSGSVGAARSGSGAFRWGRRREGTRGTALLRHFGPET